MSKTGHKAILASAGSGKTFQLAHRYIRLLAEKGDKKDIVTPDRICAMTFTRKAAGEIFDSIAKYLCKAAMGENDSTELTNARISMPHLKKDDYLKLLRCFVDNLNRARIGTFDSFIVGIARAFPITLGIPINFQVVDSGGSAAKENRQKVLEYILGPADANNIGKKFLDAFKQATYGHEEKVLDKILDTFLDKLSFQYKLCPDSTKWGNENHIWPAGKNPYKKPVKCDGPKIAANTIKWADAQVQTKKYEKNFYNALKGIASELAVYTPASAGVELLNGTLVFGRILEKLDDMKKGDVEVIYGIGKNNIYTIPFEIGKQLSCLFHNLLCIEYERMLRCTAGLHNLLSTYETVYEKVTRAAGNFSFTDIQHLLAGSDEDGTGRLISREPGIDRLYIDYRMDCNLDHWLLDEFQDTSDLQWSVFENLISEIVQAPKEDGRSFFYVGDVKQAIYRWRGGNNELFLDIIKKFNEHGNVIELEPMQKTYRCSQPVIDVVNMVFTKLPDDFPESATAKWNNIWEDHETAAEDKELGYVSLLEPPEDLSKTEAKETRCQLVADLLNEIQPVKRGLKVGILVRNNKFGKTLVNVLCKECDGMSFVHEGESGIIENEVAHLLMLMVKLAAHPGDEYAWKYIQMGPMAPILEKHNINHSNIAPQFLTEIQEDGFHEFVLKWGLRLAETYDLGPYGLDCLDRFESAAAEFDSFGSSSCNSFLRFINSYTIREQPSSKAVRVMTIHQSKGLEFDVVILPELQDYTGSNMIKNTGADLICAGGRSDPDWILKMPKRIIAENDAILNRQLEEADSEHCFDSLCMLYVAMTRAKQALYMITSKYKGKSFAFHPSMLLKQQLAGDRNPDLLPNIKLNDKDYVSLYESGKGSKWYETERWRIKKTEDTKKVVCLLDGGYAEKSDRCKMLHHREPSKQKGMTRNAFNLFEAKSTDIMDFGSAIHELFEQVEWAEDADVNAIINAWEPISIYDEQVTKDVIKQFRACMESGTVREHLSRPEGNVDTPWREKRFEVVLNSELISGAFDRVTIVRDEQGNVVSATIFDYKSSQVDKPTDIDKKTKDYTPQMDAYREALARIIGVDLSAVICCLIFTRQQVTRTV
ncbi:UvrD-helicase domain-containing protein [Verrucomicrobiota bacterium]